VAKKRIPTFIKEIQEYKPKELNYAFEKNISYSQISMFNKCEYQWALLYKEGYNKKLATSSIHSCFGTAMHETIQEYLKIMYEFSTAEADRQDIESKFKSVFIAEYKRIVEDEYKGQHFSSADELREFYEDGIAILNWFKKHKTKYFSKKNTYLVGIEVPILLKPSSLHKNLYYKGYLDLVFYDSINEKYTIYDIKTSTRGWNDYNKKDELKTAQLILYKKYFGELFNIDPKDIDVQFFIVKRKIPQNAEFAVMERRVQEFVPPHGKNKMNQANKLVENFINEAFNQDGSYKDKLYIKNPSKFTCTWCPIAQYTDLCEEGNQILKSS
jgi:hypothetical protein